MIKVRKICPTRGRWAHITTNKVVPDLELVVRGDELHRYESLGLPMHELPESVEGIAHIRQWILEKFGTEPFVMFDDDCLSCKSMMGWRTRKLAYEEVDLAIRTTAQCALDLGVTMFGWGMYVMPIGYRHDRPFELTKFVCQAVGYTRDGVSFGHMRMMEDWEAFMNAMLHDRIVWRDNRIAFEFDNSEKTLPGGVNTFRSSATISVTQQAMLARWGKYLPDAHRGRTGAGAKIVRQQPIKYRVKEIVDAGS